MRSLEAIQESLLDSILSGKGDLAFIKANGSIKAEHRLRVHQDTIFENFVAALEITYPGIWRLIGSDCARGVALAYSLLCARYFSPPLLQKRSPLHTNFFAALCHPPF